MQRCLRLRSATALAHCSLCCLRHAKTCAHCIVLFGAMLGGLCAEGAPSATAPATNRQAQDEAVQAIAFNRISPEYRQAVREVLADTSIFRRMPTQVVDCNPDLFSFMSQNPEVLVQIWKELGITKVSLERLSDNAFRLADGAGTTGKLTIVEQTCEPAAQNRIVMYVEGGYEGKPFTKPVTAECVLLLRSGSVLETNGRTYVAASLDTFVKLDRSSIELLAKALHPWVGRTADKNFADTVTFIGSFSQASEVRPERIERLAKSLSKVSPARKRRLAELAYATAKHSPTSVPSGPTANFASRAETEIR